MHTVYILCPHPDSVHCLCAGADLQNLMNEAAILAARRSLKEISKEEIADALERIIAGVRGWALQAGRMMGDGRGGVFAVCAHFWGCCGVFAEL